MTSLKNLVRDLTSKKSIWIHKAIYCTAHTGISQHSWSLALHYTPTVLKIETWKILVEKAINGARLLVTLYLINAWI